MLGRVTLQQLHNGGVYRVGIQNVIQEIDRLNGPPALASAAHSGHYFISCVSSSDEAHPRPVHVQ